MCQKTNDLWAEINSFLVKEEQPYGKKDISCKSTATNSITSGPCKGINKKTAPNLALKKVSSDAQLRRGVIKIKPTKSMKRLLKEKYLKQDNKQQPLRLSHSHKEKYITNPLKIVSSLKCLNKINPYKTININDINKYNAKNSRNYKVTKYGTCIIKDYILKSQEHDSNNNSQESMDCKTVIEYACDNNYSLICNSINEVFT